MLVHLQHYDKLLAVSGVTASNSAAPEGKSSSRDISELLAQEVEDLKDRKQQRFKSHNVDVRGCTFVIFPETPGEGVLLVTYKLICISIPVQSFNLLFFTMTCLYLADYFPLQVLPPWKLSCPSSARHSLAKC